MAHEDSFPEGLVAVDRTAGAVRLELDDTLYPLEALYGAAYTFIDRCWVLLDRPQAGRLRATLAPKGGGDDADALRALAGEFANELLSCAWRHQIAQQNRAIIEQVTAQAVAGAMGPPSLDDLAKFEFSGEALEDPLGIAVSWEEKYRDKKAAPKAKDAK
jgi:His-Xaa-Ser system protein HxsD